MRFKIEGIELNKPNKNGRVYSTELIEREVINSEVVKEQLENNCLFVELGYNKFPGVDCSKICGIVKGISIIDNSIVSVDFDFIDTPAGRIVKQAPDKFKAYMLGQGILKPIDDNTEEVVDYIFNKFYLAI